MRRPFFRFRLRTLLLLVTIACVMLALRHPPPVVVPQTPAERMAEWRQMMSAQPDPVSDFDDDSPPRNRHGMHIVNGEDLPTGLVRALQWRTTNMGRRSIQTPRPRSPIIGWRGIVEDVKQAKGHQVVVVLCCPEFKIPTMVTGQYVRETNGTVGCRTTSYGEGRRTVQNPSAHTLSAGTPPC